MLSGNMVPQKRQWGILLELLRVRVVGAGFDLAFDECTYIYICVCVCVDGRGFRLYAYLPAPGARRPTHTPMSASTRVGVILA